MLRTKRGLLRAVTSELNLPNLPAETLRAAKALAADPAAREILEAPRRPLRDYRLGRPVAFEGLSLSPSILDKSLGCRYFFFASTLLDIGDLEPAGRWEFGPLEMGTLAHRVMEKLALEAPEGKATVKKALETLKDAAGELYSWALDGRFGLALAALEHAISELIPRYLEILEAVKGVPFGAEIPLRDSEGKRPLFPLPSRVGIPKGIPMGGRIDQALKLALGTSLILDFKWGGVERKVPAQVKADLDAQAPLYAWFLREDGRFPKPAGALYMSIARDEAVFRPAKDPGGLPAMLQGKALVVNEPVLEASGTQLANKLADLLEALATPDAECAPVDGPGWDDLVKAQSDPCQYCSFGLLCRSRKRGN
jgi:hypothetical protein